MEKKYVIALELIKRYEGFSPVAYKDYVGVLTVGFGRTLGSMSPTTVEAEELWLFNKLLKLNTFLNLVVRVKQNSNQMAALMSFCYNVGENAFLNSTLLKCINTNTATEEITRQFMRWDKANGKPLAGLTKRRREEALIYRS